MANPGPAVVTGNDYLYGGDAAGGVQLGSSLSTSTVGFYGATPVVQRATATTHTTTNMVTSASFGATQVAIVQEIMNTLIALGIWAA